MPVPSAYAVPPLLPSYPRLNTVKSLADAPGLLTLKLVTFPLLPAVPVPATDGALPSPATSKNATE